MLRRFTTQAPAAAQPVDDLVAGALPDRVQIAHERLAHQDDPALLEALSERELGAARELAELVRDYERHEQRARIQAAADAAERVRRTAAELAEREAADLLRAAQAIGEQRHSSSPHAKVARLHQRKPRVLGLLAGVVAFSMLFSAVTVQQNIAPTGGVSNPMFWLSYGLEALISAVLVALMLSTGDTSEWGVIDRLWQVYTVEGVLLTASIALNTFPYFRTGDMAGIGIHMIAPIMIGVALVTHRLIAERYGRAIEQATAAVPDHEDLQERLAALTRVGGAANQILPSILASPPTSARRVSEHPAGTTEPADAPADPTLPVQPPADAAEDERSTAQPSTAQAPSATDPTATAPEQALTELWLATTPLPVIERLPAADSGGSQADAADGTDDAELNARLAAAVRQTLHRIRISEQAEPARVEHPAGPESVERPAGPESVERPAGPESVERPAGPESVEHPAGPESVERPAGPESVERQPDLVSVERPAELVPVEHPRGAVPVEHQVAFAAAVPPKLSSPDSPATVDEQAAETETPEKNTDSIERGEWQPMPTREAEDRGSSESDNHLASQDTQIAAGPIADETGNAFAATATQVADAPQLTAR
ncbi:hypothetical protein [Nocardia sp. R6R-6]|uniref:hypothetical protein n=1 Tax=Nocardia sp. R6R-6 TaxID=3459303 RepID=UPI00403DCADF